MTIDQWVKSGGCIPKGGISHLIHTNKEFEKIVVRRIGRKILLDIIALENWISNQPSDFKKKEK